MQINEEKFRYAGRGLQRTESSWLRRRRKLREGWRTDWRWLLQYSEQLCWQIRGWYCHDGRCERPSCWRKTFIKASGQMWLFPCRGEAYLRGSGAVRWMNHLTFLVRWTGGVLQRRILVGFPPSGDCAGRMILTGLLGAALKCRSLCCDFIHHRLCAASHDYRWPFSASIGGKWLRRCMKSFYGTSVVVSMSAEGLYFMELLMRINYLQIETSCGW